MNFDLDTRDGMLNAVKWQSKLVNSLSEGGTWAVPRSMSVYKIYKSMHIAVRTHGEPEIDRVFREMGWEVREEL